MIVLTGIVRADGGDGGTTRTGVINPCENPNEGKTPLCDVKPPGESTITPVDYCEHNGNEYFCQKGVPLQNDWLQSQCFAGNCTFYPPIVP